MKLTYTGNHSDFFQEFPFTGVFKRWKNGDFEIITDQTRINNLLATKTFISSTKRESNNDFYYGDSYNRALGVINPDGTQRPFNLIGSSPRSALFLGTSITASMDIQQSAVERRANAHCWVTWFLIAGEQPFVNVFNAGVSGNKTYDMVNRFESDVISKLSLFDHFFFEPGPNDTSDDNTTLSMMISNYSYIINTVLDAGKSVTIILPTQSDTITALGQIKRTAIHKWVKDTYGNNTQVRFINPDRVLTDPSTGQPLAVMYTPTYTEANKVHLSVQGAQVLGRLVWDATSDLFKKRNHVRSKLDPNQYMPNPMLSGANSTGSNNFSVKSGGQITGTGPDAVVVGNSVGTWGAGAIVVAPSVSNGVDIYAGGGFTVAVAAAPSDQAEVRVVFGAYDNAGALGTLYGRMDVARANSTAYKVGDKATLASTPGGFLRCVSPGTSAASAPAPSSPDNYGQLITDGTVTWIWQRTPVAGDTFIAEVDYEIVSQTGGFSMDCYAICERASTSIGEAWGYAEMPYIDKTITNPVFGQVGLYMPRKGKLRSLPIVLIDPGVTMRYIEVYCSLIYMNGAAVTVKFNSVEMILQ